MDIVNMLCNYQYQEMQQIHMLLRDFESEVLGDHGQRFLQASLIPPLTLLSSEVYLQHPMLSWLLLSSQEILQDLLQLTETMTPL